MHWSQQTPSSNNTRDDSTHGQHQMANTEIRLIIFFAAKHGEALYSQQKQDWKLTEAHQFSSVQSLSRVRLFATPWTTEHQASLSITNSQSLPKPMSIESVMPSKHLILCCPLLLLPSIFPSNSNPRDSQESSSTPQFKSINSSAISCTICSDFGAQDNEVSHSVSTVSPSICHKWTPYCQIQI